MSYIFPPFHSCVPKRTRNHGPPPQRKQNNSHISHILVRIQQPEEFGDEAQRIRYDAESAHDQRPKVQPAVALKGDEGEDDEFDGIVKCETEQESDDDFERE